MVPFRHPIDDTLKLAISKRRADRIPVARKMTFASEYSWQLSLRNFGLVDQVRRISRWMCKELTNCGGAIALLERTQLFSRVCWTSYSQYESKLGQKKKKSTHFISCFQHNKMLNGRFLHVAHGHTHKNGRQQRKIIETMVQQATHVHQYTNQLSYCRVVSLPPMS